MPNKYKRAVGSRTYRNYTDEILKTCLNNIINKKITQREAGKLFNIPRRTFNYKLKNNMTIIGVVQLTSQKRKKNVSQVTLYL